MISPKAADDLIFTDDSCTCVSICFTVNVLLLCNTNKRCTILSTIITAPSTINPKSIAPKDIRLAEIPNIFIMHNANNIDKGITEATIRPPLKFPSNTTSINITINPPSIRFLETVPIALSISSDLSIYGSIITPSGSDFLICSTRSFTACTTLYEFSPLSINAWPATTSPLPFHVTAPNLVALPYCTTATSLIKMGILLAVFTTIFSISEIDFTKPSPRMK